jgi:hypothetical protein
MTCDSTGNRREGSTEPRGQDYDELPPGPPEVRVRRHFSFASDCLR